MKSTSHHVRPLAILFSSMLLVVGACQDDDDNGLQIPSGTRAEQTADSIFLYAREVYRWYDALPDYTTVNPRQYVAGGDNIENLQKELFALTQYAINPDTGLPYETTALPGQPKYSFLQYEPDASPTGRASATSRSNSVHGFGVETAVLNTGELYIRQTLPGSPAATAGLHRGQQITAINGEVINIQSNEDLEKIRKAWINPSLTITLQGQEVTLSQARYTADPTSAHTLLDTPDGTTGYLALNSFPPLTAAQASLDNAFTAFTTAGITHLIIDLRYNAGGYTETAGYLLGLLAPTRLQGTVLYIEHYNMLLQKRQAPILTRQRLLDATGNAIPYKGRYATYADVDYSPEANTYTLAKHGALETITDITFITTAETASASELVIHALRPHLHVRQVGTTSYGKPVGFFPITIDQYLLWMPTFNITNATGDGDYYNGLPPDIVASDDITHDFGDPREASLATALAHTGSSRLLVGTALQRPQTVNTTPRHTGLLETRRTLTGN
jgi:C-terminal processing protease CtpA/Prc